MYNLLAESLYDSVLHYAKWGSIILVAIMLGAGIVFAFTAKTFFQKYLKYSLSVLLIYALIIGILLLILKIVTEYMEDAGGTDIIPFVFVPIVVTLFVTLCGAITFTVIGKNRDRDNSPWFKKALIIFGATVAAFVIATLVLILIYYRNNIADSYFTEEGKNFNELVLYIGAILMTAGAVAAAFLFDKDNSPFDAKMIARGGICIALSFAFSYVKLFKMPQGGSVTLASTLPIMLFAFAYGPKKGILVGFIYGMLQSVQDPYIIHPAQYLLDYPIAYTMVGFAGTFAKTKMLVQVRFALGAVLASILRFIAHVISGVFAFGAWIPDAYGNNFLLYSLAYNSTVFIDIAIAIALGVLLISNKAVRKIVLGQSFDNE